ncbi:hypothetical protein TRIUR3_05219 [Triticum urartu]|uniref:Uncharacterized protein n=1 Tax=Triticum urartu TaxID=4572 RepID=M7ZXN5_TRIUA|nr:hypothetical protein TRIUR3_05219 [Triticum urartu]
MSVAGERLRRLGLRAAAATVSSHQLGGIVDAAVERQTSIVGRRPTTMVGAWVGSSGFRGYPSQLDDWKPSQPFAVLLCLSPPMSLLRRNRSRESHVALPLTYWERPNIWYGGKGGNKTAHNWETKLRPFVEQWRTASLVHWHEEALFDRAAHEAHLRWYRPQMRLRCIPRADPEDMETAHTSASETY